MELADTRGQVAIRDSKDPDQGHFTVSRDQFRLLTEKIKAGKLDLS